MHTYTSRERLPVTLSLPQSAVTSYHSLLTDIASSRYFAWLTFISSDTNLFTSFFWNLRSPRLTYLAYTCYSPPTVLLDSKMFVGGLNWDTTDGIESSRMQYHSLYY
jgi:hypothetical protein